MKILVIVNFAIIFLIALVFSLLNFHSVEINLYITSLSMPLAVLMLLELVIGIFIGIAVMYFKLIKIKVQNAKKTKA